MPAIRLLGVRYADILRARLLLVVPCLALAACGGDDFTPPEKPADEPPADVAGSYTVTVVDHANGCNFGNWTDGQTSTGVPFTILQDGSQITGTVDGVTGTLFALWVGSNTLVGEVEGSSLSLEVQGTNRIQSNGCSYTVNAEVTAEQSGDAIQGETAYRVATDGAPACAALEDCVSAQAFSGTRPPR